jgi:hypothetical protein
MASIGKAVWVSNTSSHHRSQSAKAAATPCTPPLAYEASMNLTGVVGSSRRSSRARSWSSRRE